MNAKIKPPIGWRLLTQAERDSVRGLSSYLYVYPQIMLRIRRYVDGVWAEECQYKYFSDDSIYAVPKEPNAT